MTFWTQLYIINLVKKLNSIVLLLVDPLIYENPTNSLDIRLFRYNSIKIESTFPCSVN